MNSSPAWHRTTELDAAMRAYTVIEIDRMREALVETIPWHQSRNNEREQLIENRLRTYMVGGVAPEELEAIAKEKRDKWMEHEMRRLAAVPIVTRGFEQ